MHYNCMPRICIPSPHVLRAGPSASIKVTNDLKEEIEVLFEWQITSSTSEESYSANISLKPGESNTFNNQFGYISPYAYYFYLRTNKSMGRMWIDSSSGSFTVSEILHAQQWGNDNPLNVTRFTLINTPELARTPFIIRVKNDISLTKEVEVGLSILKKGPASSPSDHYHNTLSIGPGKTISVPLSSGEGHFAFVFILICDYHIKFLELPTDKTFLVSDIRYSKGSINDVHAWEQFTQVG